MSDKSVNEWWWIAVTVSLDNIYLLVLDNHFRGTVTSKIKRYFKDSSKRVFCNLTLSTLDMIELDFVNWDRLLYKTGQGTSLVAQGIGIYLPKQGTHVWFLVPEASTCLEATKPVHRNYWTSTLEAIICNYWACDLQLLRPTCLESVLRNKE